MALDAEGYASGGFAEGAADGPHGLEQRAGLGQAAPAHERGPALRLAGLAQSAADGDGVAHLVVRLLEQAEEAEGERERCGAVEPAAQDAAWGDLGGAVTHDAEEALDGDGAPLGRRVRPLGTQLHATTTAMALQLDGAAWRATGGTTVRAVSGS